MGTLESKHSACITDAGPVFECNAFPAIPPDFPNPPWTRGRHTVEVSSQESASGHLFTVVVGLLNVNSREASLGLPPQPYIQCRVRTGRRKRKKDSHTLLRRITSYRQGQAGN